MRPYDRLATFLKRFSLDVRQAPLAEATLVLLAGPDGLAQTVHFRRDKDWQTIDPNAVLFSAAIEWNGRSNPLVAALPDCITLDLQHDSQSAGLIALIQGELADQRCGVDPVISRLCEVLIVRLMRVQIERGSSRAGLLAGLSDARLSRALVAIHDKPGQDWRNQELAEIAGLSLSRFTEVFTETIGQPPTAYLRNWRLTVALQDVAKGDRIEVISRRYGYKSPEGFTRAFKSRYGHTPIDMRGRLAS
ncbi:MAG: AraC family transcriptional regulator [Alphaproteobacteria bacterium]|nr:AraC family transcriptional regulator [Alphaproteobacteria bacterium]